MLETETTPPVANCCRPTSIKAVMMAPSQTSRHWGRAVGSGLKITHKVTLRMNTEVLT